MPHAGRYKVDLGYASLWRRHWKFKSAHSTRGSKSEAIFCCNRPPNISSIHDKTSSTLFRHSLQYGHVALTQSIILCPHLQDIPILQQPTEAAPLSGQHTPKFERQQALPVDIKLWSSLERPPPPIPYLLHSLQAGQHESVQCRH